MNTTAQHTSAGDIAVERGLLLVVAAQIGDHRWQWGGTEPGLDLLTEAAQAAPLVEVVRMRNRLRDALDEETRQPAQPHPPRVPREELAQVRDTPVRVWTPPQETTAHHVTAVAVSPLLYLETWRGGREVPRDRFGAQVIARASVAGKEDVYAVFWHLQGGMWQQVTGELSATDMTGWTGAPLPAHERGYVARDLEGWLDLLIGAPTDLDPTG